MKIIAQSTVPTSMPYLHVGYTAASCNLNSRSSAGQTLSSIGVTILIAYAVIAGVLLLKRLIERLRNSPG